jgi:hypothetical protein
MRDSLFGFVKNSKRKLLVGSSLQPENFAPQTILKTENQ